MNIGYARVSTKDKNRDLQIQALEKARCEKVYKEKLSGSTKNRPELDFILEHLREGDEWYVLKLDPLSRSLKNIIDLVLTLNQYGVIIKGITFVVDTSTTNGRLFLNIIE